MMDEDNQRMDEEEALARAARSMPQFDVPERVTQNIMAAVAAEQQEERRASFPWPLAVLAAIAGGMLYWTSFDTGVGWLSWLVGLIAVCGLKFLFDAEDGHEQAV